MMGPLKSLMPTSTINVDLLGGIEGHLGMMRGLGYDLVGLLGL